MEQHDSPRLRASDAEREQVVAALRHAMSEGRLSLAEGEQRMAAAYATTYRDELPPLTADLPPQEHTAGTGRGDAGRLGDTGGHHGPGGHHGRWRQHPGRPRPVLLLAGLAAVAAGSYALAVGQPLWPAIVLGVVAMVLIKRGRCRSA